MDKYELSRRKVLAGLASAGGTGALIGTGTMALIGDEALFANNSLYTGALRLAVGNDAVDPDQRIFEVDMGDEGCTAFPVSLPETDGQGNETNPAYVWLGTPSCPNDPPADFASALNVSLRYTCSETDPCSDSAETEPIIEEQNFGCFVDTLGSGIRLDPAVCSESTDTDGCFAPGDSVDLRLDWKLDDDYEGDDTATLNFEFVAEQCRHNGGETSPFPTTECDAGKDISWVAFCADSSSYDDSGDNELNEGDVDFDINGPELTVSNIPDPDAFNAILLKNGTSLEEFTPDSASEVPSGDGDSASFTTVPCGPAGWDVTSYPQNGNGFEGTDRSNDSPCLSDETGFKKEVEGS